LIAVLAKSADTMMEKMQLAKIVVINVKVVKNLLITVKPVPMN
jgi:hypothetical protein